MKTESLKPDQWRDGETVAQAIERARQEGADEVMRHVEDAVRRLGLDMAVIRRDLSK